MSVNVEWKVGGDERNGIVAEGTYLWDAAKRLGVRLPAECDGRGECDTCAVVIEDGATLLSGLTDAERVRLSPERLAAGERLACQTKVEHAGDLVLRPVPVAAHIETPDEATKTFREEFGRMPLKQKLSTLVQLEAVTAYQALERVIEIPYEVFGKGLELLAVRGRKLSQSEHARQRPAEHVKATPEGGDKGTGGKSA